MAAPGGVPPSSPLPPNQLQEIGSVHCAGACTLGLGAFSRGSPVLLQCRRSSRPLLAKDDIPAWEPPPRPRCGLRRQAVHRTERPGGFLHVQPPPPGRLASPVTHPAGPQAPPSHAWHRASRSRWLVLVRPRGERAAHRGCTAAWTGASEASEETSWNVQRRFCPRPTRSGRGCASLAAPAAPLALGTRQELLSSSSRH